METAKNSGYAEDEAQQLVTEPHDYFRDNIPKQIATVLDPEAITTLFRSLDGEEVADPRPIIEIGNILYDFAKHLEGLKDDRLTAEEIKLLSFANQILETSLYRGGLSQLSERTAAAVSFLVNRLAKIKELVPSKDGVKGFDRNDFAAFAQRIDAFAEEYLSDEYGERLVQKNAEDLAAVEETLRVSDDPGVAEYLAKTAESTQMTDRLEALFGGELYSEVQEMRHRLEEIRRLFAEIYSYPPSDDSLERLNYIIDLLESVTPEEIASLKKSQSRFYDGNLLDAILSGRGYHHEYKKIKGGKFEPFDLHDTLFFHTRNLEIFCDKVRARKKIKGFDELHEKAIADQITDQMLQIRKNLVFASSLGQGGWAEVGRLDSKIKATTDEIKKLFASLTQNAPDSPVAEQIKAHNKLRNEHFLILKDKQLLPVYRERFRRSKEVLLKDMGNRKLPVTDLYFLKTALVAADKVGRNRLGHGYCGISPEADPNPIASYEMVEYSPEERQGPHHRYMMDDARRYRHSDIHYSTAYLPFAVMMTKFFKEGQSPEQSVSDPLNTD